MTYCVGIEVEEGLVLAADTRTNASLDDVRIHRKLHTFEFPGDRALVIMTAGNLATTQLVLSRLKRDLDDKPSGPNLRSFRHLFEVAEYVGDVLVGSQSKIAEGSQQADFSTQATLILGGQIAGEQPGMYMIYPLGNCIAASPETPYLQIGESKYGKPILDRIIRPETRLEDAARCALVSLDSTIRSNLSVGMPIDLVMIRNGDLRISQQMRLENDTPLFAGIHDTWSRRLEMAVHTLPRFDWEEPLSEGDAAAAVSSLPPLPPRRFPLRQDPGDQSSQQQ